MQEINQCKESLRLLIRSAAQKKIGVIFYKARQFVFGNQQAQELININLNIYIGHPISKACKQVVDSVERFQTTQSRTVTDNAGDKIIISGMPYLERTHVILLIYHQEAPDLIADQLNKLQDPSCWDYLFYLHSTEAGRLINSLIPGIGDSVLNFKIELLKITLSLKATLLDIPSEDLMNMVELIHSVSMRSNLHIIDLEEPQKTSDLMIALFGLNNFFDAQRNNEIPIMKKLNETGTLFIKNIHYLDRETQETLANFIRFGFFTCYKGKQKTFSDVRIICSSNQPLVTLVHKGIFSDNLYTVMQKSVLTIPPVCSLPHNELVDLFDGFVQQVTTNKPIEKLVEFSEKEISTIINMAPSSFLELKRRVLNLIAQKNKKSNLGDKNRTDVACLISDPELAEIARLGKHALKNEKYMAILWNKFNNQNKIATFLGVNRSSVSRRCKHYKLI